MVFDYWIRDGEGRVIRLGQIHVDPSRAESQSPVDVAACMSEALLRLGNWINTHKDLIVRQPFSIDIKIATIPIPQKG